MLNGKKTYLGVTITAIPLLIAAVQAGDWMQAATVLGGWLAAVGAIHKWEKAQGGASDSGSADARAADNAQTGTVGAAVALCAAFLVLPGCATGQQGQGPQEVALSAGHADVDFRTIEESEGFREEGKATIPMVYRDTNGVVRPVEGSNGQIVETKVQGSGIVVYVNSTVDNKAESTIAGTVEGSTQDLTQDIKPNLEVPATGGP